MAIARRMLLRCGRAGSLLTCGVSVLIRRYRGCAMTDKLAGTKPPTRGVHLFDLAANGGDSARD